MKRLLCEPTGKWGKRRTVRAKRPIEEERSQPVAKAYDWVSVKGQDSLLREITPAELLAGDSPTWAYHASIYAQDKMPVILAVDPGPVRHGWAIVRQDGAVFGAGVCHAESLEMWAASSVAPLDESLRFALWCAPPVTAMVIEAPVPLGKSMPLAAVQTAYMAGRLEASSDLPCHLMTRAAVKSYCLGSPSGSDAQTRQAIIDAYGGKEAAIGTKKTPGPLHGIAKDGWQALALALSYIDRDEDDPPVNPYAPPPPGTD